MSTSRAFDERYDDDSRRASGLSVFGDSRSSVRGLLARAVVENRPVAERGGIQWDD